MASITSKKAGVLILITLILLNLLVTPIILQSRYGIPAYQSAFVIIVIYYLAQKIYNFYAED